MPDREKVMKALECCMRENNTVCLCGECPYHTESTMFSCMQNVMRDALALLKEREEGITPIESTRKQKEFADKIGIAVSDFWCGACHFNLIGHPKFCPNCGKKVKWNA